MANNETPAPFGTTYDVWDDGAVLVTHVDKFGNTTEMWLPPKLVNAMVLEVVTKSLKS
jgi:hypothetical protein